jgi:peroxiredoxin
MATGMTQTAKQSSLTGPSLADPSLAESLCAFHTETGRSLLDLVDESPVLLIFLRHFSCAFCAQTLDRVAKVRAQIEAKGARPVFVHLGSPERAKPYFDYYSLSDVERISNPEATLYQLPFFALSRTNPYLHLLNPTVWKGWLSGAMFKYGIGMIKEDAEQMPGVFLIKDRTIVRAFRHKTIADEPDYLKLVGTG